MASRDQIAFDIGGMTCSDCADRAEAALRGVPGVEAVHINLVLERADVRGAAGRFGFPDLARAVAEAGFVASPLIERPEIGTRTNLSEMRREEQMFLLLGLLLTAPFLIDWLLPFAVFPGGMPAWAQLAFATPLQFWIGARFYRGALAALRRGGVNGDVVLVAGTTLAFGASLYQLAVPQQEVPLLYFRDCALVLTAAMAGRWIEGRIKSQMAGVVKIRTDALPHTALIDRDGELLEAPVEALEKGTICIVRAGAVVPCDGIVRYGESDCDERHVLGAAPLAAKAPGDRVYAGAINGSGELRIEAMAWGGNTVLSGLGDMLQNAQSSRINGFHRIDRLAGLGVYLAFLAGLSGALAWWLAGADPWVAGEIGVATLLIVSPVALGLAVPSAMVSGLGAAAARGIAFARMAVLETAYQARTVILDKTGTLTLGRPVVSGVHAINRHEEDLIAKVAAVEAQFAHPLAQAILDYARDRKVEVHATQAQGGETFAGRGIGGMVGGAKVVIGSRALMASLDIDLGAEENRARDWEKEGRTVFWVAVDGDLAGLVGAEDRLRAGARQAVAALRAQHMRTVLLSGDGPIAVARIAQDCGIDEAHGHIDKAGKAQFVAERGADGPVAMVGDATAEAEAVAAAQVGIAFAGTPGAADVVILRPDPALIPMAFETAAAIRSKIGQNLTLALVYNGVAGGLALAGLVSPGVAGIAGGLIGAVVLINARRLGR